MTKKKVIFALITSILCMVLFYCRVYSLFLVKQTKDNHFSDIVVNNHSEKNVQKTSTQKEDSKNIKIVIDAGHGGKDPGAISPINDKKESDLNLAIASKLKVNLEACGYTVKMTRTGDETIGLKERSDISNAENADLFISIHQNSYSSGSANGITTYFNQNKEDVTLANHVQEHMIQETHALNRGTVGEQPLSVLHFTAAEALLIETGFLTNASEIKKLSTDEYQDKIALGIMRGINQYYNFACYTV